jgi:hypothetical protein
MDQTGNVVLEKLLSEICLYGNGIRKATTANKPIPSGLIMY